MSQQPSATTQTLITLQMQANQSLQQLQSVMSQLLGAFNGLMRALMENTRAIMKVAVSPTAFKASQLLPSSLKSGIFPSASEFGQFMKFKDVFADIDAQINTMVSNIAGSPAATKKTKDKGGGGLAIFNEMGKSMGNFFSMMGPQMVALALVTEPLTAFLEAFLEPLGMVSDYFGAFGSILSQALIPILTALQPLLDGLIPVFSALVPPIAAIFTALTPLIAVFVGFLPVITSLLPLINLIAAVIVNILNVMTALMPLTTVGFNLLSGLIDVITYIIAWCITPMQIAIQAIGDVISWVVEKFTNFTDGLKTMWDNLNNFDWDKIGTLVTGGGADKYGWW